MAYQSGWVSIVEFEDGQVVADKLDAGFGAIDTQLAIWDNVINENFLFLKPQVDEVNLPRYPVGDPKAGQVKEGVLYYDDAQHSFIGKNDISDTKLNLGSEMIERVWTPDATAIGEGLAVTVHDSDIQDGAVEVTLASCTSFASAIVFGVTTSTIGASGTSVGIVTKEGRVNGVATNDIAVNGLVYLGENGTFVKSINDVTTPQNAVVTVIGYVVKASSTPTAMDGVIYVNIQNIISLPNVVAYMKRILPTTSTSLYDVPLVVDGFDPLISGGVLMPYNAANGEVLSTNVGIYDAVINFNMSFTDIGNIPRHVLIEVMEDDGAGGVVAAVQSLREISRDSVVLGASFTETFGGDADMMYYVQVSCVDATLGNFVIENFSFSLKSIDLR